MCVVILRTRFTKKANFGEETPSSREHRRHAVKHCMYELVREFRLDEARVRLQNLFWNNEPVTLILPTMQGGDKKYVGGDSWTLGLKLSKAACWLPNSRSHVSRSSSKYMLSLSLSFAVSINGKFMNLSDSRGGNAA